MNLNIEHVEILTSDSESGIQNAINNKLESFKKKGSKYIVNDIKISTVWSAEPSIGRIGKNYITYTAMLLFVEKN